MIGITVVSLNAQNFLKPKEGRLDISLKLLDQQVEKRRTGSFFSFPFFKKMVPPQPS